MSEQRWRLERDARGEIVKVARVSPFMGMPDCVVSDPLWAEVARLAAQEERERIARILGLDYVRLDSLGHKGAAQWAWKVSERIERGDHWRPVTTGDTDAK